jgi:hypothetical protein
VSFSSKREFSRKKEMKEKLKCGELNTQPSPLPAQASIQKTSKLPSGVQLHIRGQSRISSGFQILLPGPGPAENQSPLPARSIEQGQGRSLARNITSPVTAAFRRFRNVGAQERWRSGQRLGPLGGAHVEAAFQPFGPFNSNIVSMQ